MHLKQDAPAGSRKRKRQDNTNSAPDQFLPTKKHKRTPSSFFDTLSRQSLTSRTLREFDRRTRQTELPTKPQRLGITTSISLKRFARHGGPDLDDLRAYPEPSQASKMPREKEQERKRRNSSPGGKSSKRTASDTTRSSAYDAAFEMKMIDNGFFPEGYNDDVEPTNMGVIRLRLNEPRPSLSPSRFDQEAFKNFRKANRDASTEKEVMVDVFPIIVGNGSQKGKQDVLFNNLAELAPDIQEDVKVDFYDGSAPTSLRKRIRDQLGQYIVPSTTLTAPILPNFVVEAKGPRGGALTVKNQALHAGAIGARGMLELKSFANPQEPIDGNAYTIASTYGGGSGGGLLTLYSIHPTSPSDPSRQQDYHMTQLDAFAMHSSLRTFREGAIAFRNARDWARSEREKLITAANAKHDETISASTNATAQTGLSQSVEIIQLDSDTSADELSVDVVASGSSTIRRAQRTTGPSKSASHGCR